MPKTLKVLETEKHKINVSTEISKAGPSLRKSTQSSSFNLQSFAKKKLIRNTKILYTSFQCFSSINITQRRSYFHTKTTELEKHIRGGCKKYINCVKLHFK